MKKQIENHYRGDLFSHLYYTMLNTRCQVNRRKSAKRPTLTPEEARSMNAIRVANEFARYCKWLEAQERKRIESVRAEHTVCKGGWDKMTEEEFQRARRAEAMV